MGGTEWDRVVPYNVDVSAALTMARVLTFREGDYYWVHDGRWGFPERPRPGSIHELWADPVVRETGTHSVLDIWDVCGPDEESRIASAAPLTRETAHRLFGTDRPTRDDYQRAKGSLWGVVEDRGHGYYVVLYRDGVPDEISFFEVMGD
ncbi:hypothetical protein [Actinomadura sp. 21ATH]|uniref:hypothetical protein n=1 Tax=Actinomadura sp. 21ATH TaxID=1735444 RepID=UPI0035C08317